MNLNRTITFTMNGKKKEIAVDVRQSLLEVLREQLGMISVKQGCAVGECGACTVLIDGKARPACITLAATCDGRAVETVEGLARDGHLSALQRAFHERLGVQCGFCTPGMIIAAEALLRDNARPDEVAIRDALSGNLCRCTGYVKIIEAVQAAAEVQS